MAADVEEIEETHTDPEATTTYEITNEHEEYFGRFADAAEVSTIFSASSTSASMTQETELNDGSDDFDFVMLESDESSGLDRVSFRAIDGTRRSDVWFNNEDEVTYGTDPWDPDTDDDGLTDGWEVEGIITYPPNGFEQSYRFDMSPSLDTSFAGTSAIDPDTDGDGYWDGWIGVYEVGYTDNIVLYQEHLQSGNGIEADEMVIEQSQYHEVSEAPSAMGADINNDGNEDHSNVHIGERHWEEVDGSESGDPIYPSDTPSLTLTVEVDNVINTSWTGDGAITAIENSNGVSIETAVERNYALYGIDVNLIQDDNVTQDQMSGITEQEGYPPYDSVTPAGLNRWELTRIEDEYHDNDSRLHLLWGTTLQNDSPNTLID